MITYSTNMMGPISMQWYEERGLTKTVREVLEEGQTIYPKGLGPGDVWEYEVVTTYYAGGRIDIRGVLGDEYWNGWHEYSLPIMHGEDWNALSEWLDSFSAFELWEYEDLIEEFEEEYGRKIRWADDTWYKCYECGLVTDLRETEKQKHKMDCSKNWWVK